MDGRHTEWVLTVIPKVLPFLAACTPHMLVHTAICILGPVYASAHMPSQNQPRKAAVARTRYENSWRRR